MLVMISIAADVVSVTGLLEFAKERDFGLIRMVEPSNSKDVYVSASQIKKFNLREADTVSGYVRSPKENEKFYSLMKISKINGVDPLHLKERPHFKSLTPIHPNRKISLENCHNCLGTRIIDLFTPIGFAQRGLIVAPPKAGKTTLIKDIAKGIAHNHPHAKLIILLIDERPEEVTDIKRSVNAEVVSSTFDEIPENHIRVTELVLERAMRLIEQKDDVIILMDSITRLTRAYNLVVSSSGRTLSGGMDPAAFYRPKRFFGAARNIEEGGSLTIIATALVDTGSRLDEVIYEEFKGTGNMELQLDRKLAERRIFPAIDILRSGTRKEEMLIAKDQLDFIWNWRKGSNDPIEFMSKTIKLFNKVPSNKEITQHLTMSR